MKINAFLLTFKKVHEKCNSLYIIVEFSVHSEVQYQTSQRVRYARLGMKCKLCNLLYIESCVVALSYGEGPQNCACRVT